MKFFLIQAKRCAEEFAKVVGLEFIDRCAVNEHLHLNIKMLILVTTPFISSDVSYEKFVGHQCSMI